MSADTRHRPGHRVLVTGAGGAPGLDLARSLQRHGCQVITADADPLAAGLLLPGVIARTVPAAADPAYGPGLLRLCRDLRPTVLMSCVEAELPNLADLRGPLADLGVRTWLPDRRGIDACLDKAAFAAATAAHGIPTPATWLPDRLDQVPAGLPLVVKPRRGQGAQGVHACTDVRQAAVLCELVPDPIVQERIEGAEFTADCLVDRAGRASVILRYRLRVKGGLAVVAETFHDEHVTQVVTATLTAVGATGLCCAQGFVTGDGPAQMTEVNARVGGGFPLAEAAGADLIGQGLAGHLGRPVDHDQLTYRPGVRLTKYAETLSTSAHPSRPVPAGRAS